MLEKNEQRLCPDCYQLVPAAARKCHHCGRFFNWRRFTNLSSLVLSLFLAIISVSTVLLTVAQDAFMPRDSAIEVSLVQHQRAYFNDRGAVKQVLVLEMFATNGGTRPGVIKTLAVKPVGAEEFEYLRFGELTLRDEFSQAELPSRLVEPGSSILLKAYLKTSMSVENFNRAFQAATLRFGLVNFSGSEIFIETVLPQDPPAFYAN